MVTQAPHDPPHFPPHAVPSRLLALVRAGSGYPVIAAPGPVSRLGIGNSYEYYFTSPSRLEELLILGGYTAASYYAGDGGLKLTDQVVRPGTISAIASQAWSHGLLQGRSDELTVASGLRAAGIAAGVELAGMFLDASADCRILVQHTPAYGVGHADVDGAPFTDPADMYQQVKEGVDAFLQALRSAYPGRPFGICRWGEMVWYMGGNLDPANPDFVNLHDPDFTHPNSDSTCLKVFAEFVADTGLDPTPWAEALIAGQGELDPEIDVEALATFAFYGQRHREYPPIFLVQPSGQSLDEGDTISLAVEALGLPSPSLQWYKDGVAIAGATAATLEIEDAAAGDAGDYLCRATNARGSHDSAEVTVAVAASFLPFSIDHGYGTTSGPDSGYTVISSDPSSLLSPLLGIEFPLYDRSGAATPYVLEVVTADATAGSNTNGILGALGTPNNVSGTHWIGQATAIEWKIKNLPQVRIRWGFMGTRSNDGSHRETMITVVGATTQAVTYNAGSTPGALAYVDVTPDSNGEVLVRLEKGTGNTVGFSYLGWATADLVP